MKDKFLIIMKINSPCRPSIVNILINNFIFTCVKWRLFSLRLGNRIKTMIKGEHHQLSNDSLTAKAFLCFMGQGYTKVNIGGGAKNLKGFVNIDFVSHPCVEREVKANILDLSFIPDVSVSHVHSNHLAEHLSPPAFKQQLSQYYRIMRRQGLLTMRCPNALGVCYGFWFGVIPEVNKNEFLNLGFPEDEDFYNPLDGRYHKNFYRFLHWIYGDAGNIRNQHLNILTPSKIRTAVTGAGFNIVKISEPESSNIIIIARKE